MTALDPSLRDTTAITGVGYTPFSRSSGRTVLDLAVEAVTAALDDAGLAPADVGGIVDFQHGDSPASTEVAVAIGAPPEGWFFDISGGGQNACMLALHAALAINAGLATHVVCYRAMNGRSGTRMGNFVRGGPAGPKQFLAPFGLETTPSVFALLAQRHMHEYGTTQEQLGRVAVTQRAYAVENDRAVMREPLTMDAYMNARVIAEPFRLFDCCQETDGACAFVVSRADAAQDAPHPPVYIRGGAYSAGPGAQGTFDRWPSFSETSATYVAPELWASAGVGPGDVDVAQLYDSFTWAVIAALEGFGFCGVGEGGGYVEEKGIGLDSPMPVNTAGGLLSEGYIHGVNLITEAVLQLRGACGPRQRKGAEIALVTATGAVPRGSALVLRR